MEFSLKYVSKLNSGKKFFPKNKSPFPFSGQHPQYNLGITTNTKNWNAPEGYSTPMDLTVNINPNFLSPQKSMNMRLLLA